MKMLRSPNFSDRNGEKVSMLVMHYTGMRTAQEAIDRLRDPEAQVSAHYVVDEDGTAYNLVDETQCAWHAGVSYWRGYLNVNPISVSIEIVNPGHEFGYRAFPQAQMEAVAQLASAIVKRHGIEGRNVVGHSDVAPTRKQDPGERFDWPFLASAGIGVWPEAVVAVFSRPASFERGLEAFGYEPSRDEAHLAAIIAAFQRHFRPARVNGVWDEECDDLLAALLQMV